jgi:predicted transcriptional regulator
MEEIPEIIYRTSAIEELTSDTKRQVAEHTKARAAAVERLRAAGHSWAEIGKQLGVTGSRVQQYAKGQPSNAERLRRRKARQASR